MTTWVNYTSANCSEILKRVFNTKAKRAISSRRWKKIIRRKINSVASIVRIYLKVPATRRESFSQRKRNFPLFSDRRCQISTCYNTIVIANTRVRFSLLGVSVLANVGHFTFDQLNVTKSPTCFSRRVSLVACYFVFNDVILPVRRHDTCPALTPIKTLSVNLIDASLKRERK